MVTSNCISLLPPLGLPYTRPLPSICLVLTYIQQQKQLFLMHTGSGTEAGVICPGPNSGRGIPSQGLLNQSRLITLSELSPPVYWQTWIHAALVLLLFYVESKMYPLIPVEQNRFI